MYASMPTKKEVEAKLDSLMVSKDGVTLEVAIDLYQKVVTIVVSVLDPLKPKNTSNQNF